MIGMTTKYVVRVLSMEVQPTAASGGSSGGGQNDKKVRNI